MFVNRIHTLRCLFVLACILWGRPSLGNLASPFPVHVNQPDGTKIVLYLRGTEHLNWYEYVPEAQGVSREVLGTQVGVELGKNSGFTVVRDSTGKYVYASLDANGDWIPTQIEVGKNIPPEGTPRRLLPSHERVEARVASSIPGMHEAPVRRVSASGTIENLVILLRFKDHKQRTLPTPADFDVLFNSVGGHPSLAPTGSIFDYYNENSFGKMKLRSKIVGWIDLPKNEADYAGGDSGLTTSIWEAIRDGLNGVVAGGSINFADFDNEGGGVGDGFIDSITFVHSGYAAEFGGTDSAGADFKDRIWSHRWAIPTWSSNPAGVKVSNYNINPGLWATSGSDIGRIGVIAHELGHFYGLPDLYDTSGAGEGIGSWCLMANSWGFDFSQFHPPQFSAWCKKELGWLTPTAITSAGTYRVTATSDPSANVWRIDYSGGSTSEYLLIENRQPIGNYDGGIPPGTDGVKGGLAVWHIDENKTANDQPGFPGQPGWPGNGKHYKVALLQADGLYSLEKGDPNRGDGNDVFRGTLKSEITATTLPSSSSYNGLTILPITKISNSATTMTFDFGEVEDKDDGENVCCQVTGSGLVLFGAKATQNSKIASATITLKEDSIVHLTANGSVSSDQAIPLLITNGFFDLDVPTDPTLDQMWSSSLRFVTIPSGQWTNFGSTAAIPLPRGTHTIYWKVWVSAASVEFDFGTMLVEAFPNAAMQSSASKAAMRSSERPSPSKGSSNARDEQTLCCPAASESLLALISNRDESEKLRIEAIEAASDLAKLDFSFCCDLSKVLSKIINDSEDLETVRERAVEAIQRLVN